MFRYTYESFYLRYQPKPWLQFYGWVFLQRGVNSAVTFTLA